MQKILHVNKTKINPIEKLNTIEEAIVDIKAGKVVVVADDENRENEGDFIAAAETVTPEMINFMATTDAAYLCPTYRNAL